MDGDKLGDSLRSKALELGAHHARVIKVDQLCLDSRTYLNCMFGCDDWGRKHTCPSAPGALKPWEYHRIIREYSWGLLIHCHRRADLSRVCVEVERLAFAAGQYFAFALADCTLCGDNCTGTSRQDCRSPHRARPSMQGVGIDVFATVRRLGLPLEVLAAEGQEENWYGTVLVE